MENNQPGVLAQTAKLMSDEHLDQTIAELEQDVEDPDSTSVGRAYTRFSLDVFHNERGSRLLSDL